MSSTLAQATAAKYQEDLLRGAEHLRLENTLCDTTILVDNKEFRAHKIILICSCPFFRGLFTNNMKETHSDVIKLGQVSSLIMDDLLKFMYTGRVNLTTKNVHKLLIAADYLLITSLKSICTEFLQQSLTPSNCLSTVSFAQKYCSVKLQEAAAKFTCDHFVEVSKSDEFVRLNHHAVAELISDEEIVITKEEEVYEAIVRWVEHDYEARKTHFEELFLKNIQLTCISKNYLACMQQERAVTCSLRCMNAVTQAMRNDALPTINKRRSLSRDANVFICCGGFKATRGKYYNCIYHWEQEEQLYDICRCGTLSEQNLHTEFDRICA